MYDFWGTSRSSPPGRHGATTMAHHALLASRLCIIAAPGDKGVAPAEPDKPPNRSLHQTAGICLNSRHVC